MNNFDVLKEMGARDMKVALSPLDNITNLKKVKHGTQVTIGVAGDLVAALGIDHIFVGGLLLADKAQFNSLKSEMQKLSPVKTRAEIEAEIESLKPIAKDYDTDRQSNDTCLAAGAHDALRWALGLAEDSISDTLKHWSTKMTDEGNGRMEAVDYMEERVDRLEKALKDDILVLLARVEALETLVEDIKKAIKQAGGVA